MKKKTGKRFFFHENPKTMAEEALHSMSSHDNGLTSPPPLGGGAVVREEKE